MANFEFRKDIADRESKERAYESIIDHEIHKKPTGRRDMLVLKVKWGKDDGGDDIEDTLASSRKTTRKQL